MHLPLDHIVILVADLASACGQWRDAGFTVQPGGTHAEGSTHNALVVFADGSYLELIAFLRPDARHRWSGHAQAQRFGLVDWALLPPSVGAVVSAAAQRGLAYTGPIDSGRLRPDGVRLDWQMGLPPVPELPFLCGDVTPRALRVPEGDGRQHANGAAGVACVTVALADFDAGCAAYGALLGQTPVALVQPGLGLRQAQCNLGSTRLLLVAPAGDGSAIADAAARLLQTALGGRAAGIVGLALHGAANRRLPPGLTGGAALELLAGR